jgi:nucleotide-binding universal stress UspA family protein
MINTVVVPWDGSPASSAALEPGRALAASSGATLRLVCAAAGVDAGELDEIRAGLEQLAAESGASRVETALVVDRDPVKLILAEGRDEGTVVCMATHGRGGLVRLALGSVAQAVLRGSERPLLVVGPSLAPGPWRFEEGEMLVTIDGSDASEAVVPVAANWAKAFGLRAWVVQVLSMPVPPADDAQAVAESAGVRRVAARFDGRGVEWEVLHGPDPADALLDYAQQLPAVLIAMASHGRTGIARLALGSTAMRLVHGSRCPVLVTRSPGLTA